MHLAADVAIRAIVDYDSRRAQQAMAPDGDGYLEIVAIARCALDCARPPQIWVVAERRAPFKISAHATEAAARAYAAEILRRATRHPNSLLACIVDAVDIAPCEITTARG